jgi:hypothetical protein
MYNFLDIQFPESQIGRVFSYMTTLTMSRYGHETLTMYLENWGVDYKQIEVHAPVKAIVQSPLGRKEFTGYVHTVTPELSPTKNFVEVVAFGASVVMKQASQKVWTKVTADQVVTEIAKKHNFSYHSTPHPRVYDHLAQTGETDWEFICKLAYKSGHTLRAEGTALYFDPFYKDFNDFKASAPEFVMREANHPNGSSLYSFYPTIGEALVFDGAMKAATAVGGVDLGSSNPLVVTNPNRPNTTRGTSRTESYDRFHTKAVVPDATVAIHEAIAADERARYPYRGTAVVIGDARLKPDMPVFLNGIGDDYSGLWTVLETTHHIEAMKFTTEIVVGTDSLGPTKGAAVQAPNKIPVRVVSPLTPAKSKYPTSKFSKNTTPKNKSITTTGAGSKIKNRQQPAVTRSTKSAPGQWVGTSGNLRQQPTKSNATAAAVASLRSRGVR